MKEYGLYESAAVKVQTIKTAIEVSLLRLFFSLLGRTLTIFAPSPPHSLLVYYFVSMSESRYAVTRH